MARENNPRLHSSCKWSNLASQVLTNKPQVFLRGSKVILPGTLPGVKRATVEEVRRMSRTLTHLEITGHAVSDVVFSGTLAYLPHLEHIDLR